MQERRIAVRGIIFKDGKLLSQKLTAYRRDNRDFWCTPGGGLDMGEQLEEGLRRELIEETGIDPKVGRLLFVQQFSEDGKKEQMEFFFLVENPEDYGTIDLAATTHGELEIEQVEFIDPKNEVVLPAFLQTVDLERLTSTVQPVQIYNETAPL
ncbi:MAG TPA: NUDIX domain-containing protein [Verrucomicrobiae bacterium]|jgi:8-oxo-dGTP diphosphatase|nr:NUDIX domain-containing protein [Verrucomicrobiae bacterium]